MPISRNYKAEYQRRIARAAAKGLSRSQGRGHAKASEPPIRPPKARSPPDARLEEALRKLRAMGNQTVAAKGAGVSTERFRKFLHDEEVAKREGKGWIFTDIRPRRMTAITTRGSREITVAGFDRASLLGKHFAARGKFLSTNDIKLLAPFRGLSVKDTSGRIHFLETDPNALHRLAISGTETFEMVYRLKP